MVAVLRKISDYNPLNDPIYMSSRMRQYFQEKLQKELQKLLEEESFLAESLSEVAHREPDFVDQSVEERLRFNNYAHLEHEQHLRSDVESALQRLDDGSYGYCVATGKPIGIERLIAAPYALYCFDVQTEKEEQGKYGVVKTFAVHD